MAYTQPNLISICDGLECLNNSDFRNENEFIDNLIPKLSATIKEMYGLDMDGYKKEVSFLGIRHGLKFGIRPDILIKTKQDTTIIVECKNLKLGNKKGSFESMSQMMHYKFLLDVGTQDMKYKLILATNYFEFELMQFMAYYGLDFIDIVINKRESSGYWLNEIKEIQSNN